MKQLFNNINNKKKAFTLIELLIVIAIIGILSGAVIVAMSGTQESAIDSRIKASMAQLRSSIEIYGLVNGANYTGLESDSEISLLIDDIESQVGTPTVNISGSGDRYCLSTNLKSSNELWCIDSAGFAGLGGCINYSCDTSLGYSSGGIPISTGLVGYWTMDEDSLLSSNTIRDYSPYGNTGTIYGATFATDRMGQANKAMSFDGTSDYINIGGDSSLKLENSGTIIAWIYPKAHSNYAAVIIKGTGITGKCNYLIGQYNISGKYRFRIDIKGTQYTIVVDGVKFNEWTHLAGVYDGTNMKFYVNGESKGTIACSGSAYTDNSALVLGRDPYAQTDRFFKGSIDDVRIYNRALSEPEIKTLYNSYNPNIKMKTSLPKIKFSKALIRDY